MRVGIIGGGFGLNVQAPLINTHPKMQVTAVSTMMRHQLPEALLHWDDSPAHYINWTEMLDQENIELVFVSSVPVYHYEMVKYAIKKGIHVVCEKPFTMNCRESEELMQLAQKHQVKVIVDFEWRFLPVRQKVKSLIADGGIGELLHFEYHISSPQYQRLRSSRRGWMGEKRKFGGMLGALGTHMIDCLRLLGHDEMELVQGMVHTHVPEGAGEHRDADDAFFIHGKMKSGFTFSIQLLSGINHGFGSELKIFGSSGTVTLTDDERLCFGKANDQLTGIEVEKPEVPLHLTNEAGAYYPAFHPFLDKVYEFIAFDRMDSDLPTVLDGHENQRAIDKILEVIT
ncbi:Gfo/Idh/MocA family oxidoreductase [Paenibacillus donghaensis]|uniref:Gfo/Idh/MocA family protein n=1 Tax=Paenibacillus donghaensis TaxID=414771 RepID=UPI0018847722|nr:Gfo/Idh/MocA family oxidoreductase [Paenibacillus donghaensis]MBE9914661.1 Gfo/Idh/MocA family oxidoreductase [Paenibacillus donghaensis]